jgi:hypothetical protein
MLEDEMLPQQATRTRFRASQRLPPKGMFCRQHNLLVADLKDL